MEPVAHQATFSSYKNKNTVKVFVGTSPGGLVTYVLPAYGGSTSDCKICERSSLTEICEPSDSVVVVFIIAVIIATSSDEHSFRSHVGIVGLVLTTCTVNLRSTLKRLNH